MDTFIKDLLDALAELSTLIDHMYNSLCACKNKETMLKYDYEMCEVGKVLFRFVVSG